MPRRPRPADQDESSNPGASQPGSARRASYVSPVYSESDSVGPPVIRHASSVPTSATRPSSYSITSRATSRGSAVHGVSCQRQTFTEVSPKNPRPSSAPTTLSPARSSSVTSWVTYRTVRSYAVKPGSRTASLTGCPFSRRSAYPRPLAYSRARRTVPSTANPRRSSGALSVTPPIHCAVPNPSASRPVSNHSGAAHSPGWSSDSRTVQ
ncbi:hypothetical protein JOF29_007862 [Kribbella aluminosa]|uniref:Uncharacterized protein n=1 Tax=Kribbella aluminosa TaxID=416017 RepID=A0ABS4UYP4_9ACTN|nr:hypothetical protein [Kribbella aluminosa]